MIAAINGTCFCCTGAWSMQVWCVVLVDGKNGLTVSTALAYGFLVGVTFIVWKIGSAHFSYVLATNIASSCENLCDYLVSKVFSSPCQQKTVEEWICLLLFFDHIFWGFRDFTVPKTHGLYLLVLFQFVR